MLWAFVEGIAVLIVSSCVIPVATILLMFWFAKVLFWVSVKIPWGKLTRSGRRKALAESEIE